MADIVSIVASLVPIRDLVKSVEVHLDNYFKKKEQAKEDRLKELGFILNTLDEIVRLHLEAIDEVAAPILDENDFLTTYLRYKELVNNRDLPRGYARTKGFIKSAYSWPEAQKNKKFLEDMKKVRFETRNFQYAAFIIEPEPDEAPPPGKAGLLCFPVLNHFSVNKDLFDLYSDPDTSKKDQISNLKSQILGNFPTVFSFLQSKHGINPPEPVTKTIDTREDLISLNKEWFRAWQQSVHDELFSGDGIDAAISGLRATIIAV